MREITLQARPNQAFSMVLDNITYRIRVFDGGFAGMLTDINMNTENVALAVRAHHGDFLLPFAGMTQGGGNFMWFDDQAGPVRWENFGTNPTCRLYYVSAEEIQLIINSRKTEIINVVNPPNRRRLIANGEFKADGSQKANGWVTE